MLLTIAAFLFVISIVVFVHELGHFVAAKLNGIYVMTFSFGFGPKLLRKRVGETEYAISAFPLGGYVKFAGEGEGEGEEAELSEEEQIELELAPGRLYRNKSPLQKIIVILAGPFMNIVLAIFVYVFSLYANGIYVLNPTTVIGQVSEGSAAADAGLEPGDEILAVNGERLADWEDLYEFASYESEVPSTFTVARGADTLTLKLAPRPDEETGRLLFGIGQLRPPRVGDVQKDSPADKAGVRWGSIILAINDTMITEFTDIQEMVQPRPGVALKFTWEHEGIIHTEMITPGTSQAAVEGERLDVVDVGSIGIGEYYERIDISFPDAVKYGVRAFNGLVAGILDFLWKLVRMKATIRAVGGPLRVGMMAGEMVRWGFNYLISFLAFFSVNLAIFNLLPILPFDGGHFVIYLGELITRRKMNMRAMQVLMRIGFIFFITLVVLILFVDVLNLIK